MCGMGYTLPGNVNTSPETEMMHLQREKGAGQGSPDGDVGKEKVDAFCLPNHKAEYQVLILSFPCLSLLLLCTIPPPILLPIFLPPLPLCLL